MGVPDYNENVLATFRSEDRGWRWPVDFSLSLTIVLCASVALGQDSSWRQIGRSASRSSAAPILRTVAFLRRVDTNGNGMIDEDEVAAKPRRSSKGFYAARNRTEISDSAEQNRCGGVPVARHGSRDDDDSEASSSEDKSSSDNSSTRRPQKGLPQPKPSLPARARFWPAERAAERQREQVAAAPSSRRGRSVIELHRHPPSPATPLPNRLLPFRFRSAGRSAKTSPGRSPGDFSRRRNGSPRSCPNGFGRRTPMATARWTWPSSPASGLRRWSPSSTATTSTTTASSRQAECLKAWKARTANRSKPLTVVSRLFPTILRVDSSGPARLLLAATRTGYADCSEYSDGRGKNSRR